jgi:hypothetical protein
LALRVCVDAKELRVESAQQSVCQVVEPLGGIVRAFRAARGGVQRGLPPLGLCSMSALPPPRAKIANYRGTEAELGGCLHDFDVFVDLLGGTLNRLASPRFAASGVSEFEFEFDDRGVVPRLTAAVILGGCRIARRRTGLVARRH